ncbi:MAG: hypothetical protein ABIJ45_06990 [Candidatus Zixiibacteriota bacterium]
MLSFVRKMILICCSSVLISITASGQTVDIQQSREIVLYYFDLIQSGNYESANGFWEPSALTPVNRLGIKYENIPIKQDFNAPIIQQYPKIKDALNNSLISNSELESGVIRWQQLINLGPEKLTHFYYTEKKDKFFWLILPINYYTRGCITLDSKYFKFFINPSLGDQINPIVTNALDKFVYQMCMRLGLTEDLRLNLEKEKIFYYYSASEIEVEILSGKREIGVYDQATDAIMTSIPADYFNISKLLINYRLQNLKPVTVPFMRDGLAAVMGGQWQRTSGVILDFGNYIMNYDLLEMDSILMYNPRSPEGLKDLYIPASASFVEYIYKQLGNDRFFALYNSLSTEFNQIDMFVPDTIKDQICAALEKDWISITSDYKNHLKNSKPSGGIYPGAEKADKILIENNYLNLGYSKNMIDVAFKPDSLRPYAAILLARDTILIGKTSSLYKLHFGPDSVNDGYRYGIMIDKNEIGLYDYALNKIIGKYIDNSGQPSGYYDSDKQIVKAYFDRVLLDDYDFDNIKLQIIE